MADEDDIIGAIDPTFPEQEALRLKNLAEENYTSNNLKFALKYAKLAYELHPSLDGLHELLIAFEILRTAAMPISPVDPGSNIPTSPPDYYKILDVERFSNVNIIKKQYRKLALTLHPDKTPFVASEEAFKVVGEAMGILSDKIRKKEYDMRLRIAMQAEMEAEAVEVERTEKFKTLCSACGLLHQFERKYLGHSLMCPSCKKSFKAVEVEEDREIGGNVSAVEEETGPSRVSARILDKVAKGGKLSILEKFGLGVKRKSSSLGDVMERSGVKMARNVDGDGGLGIKAVEKNANSNLTRVRKTVNIDETGNLGNSNGEVGNEVRSRRVGSKEGDNDEVARRDGVEIVASEKAKRTKAKDEESMTLAQILKLGKKKVNEGKLMVKEKQVKTKGKEDKKVKEMVNRMEEKEKEQEKEKEADEETEKEKENDMMTVREMRDMHRASRSKKREKPRTSQKGNLDLLLRKKDKKGNEEDKITQKEQEREEENDGGTDEKEENVIKVYTRKKNLQSVSKTRNLKVIYGTSAGHVNMDTEDHRASQTRDLDRTPFEKYQEEEERNKETEKINIGEKRRRRRVSKYGNLDFLKDRMSEDHMNSEMKRLQLLKKRNLEIMPVEDSDFHDFDRDRRERSFKKGQVWAVYDEDNGMPRHYALVDEVVSVNPFQVTLYWLQFQSERDDELISGNKMRFQVSCGRFKVSSSASIKYLNLFSHIVDCERIAREVYTICPTKGSIWALYNGNDMETEGTDQRIKDKQTYDIVVSLSSYSDIYGLSIAYLEKVDGFRTVFKRKEIGPHAVILLGKDDMKLFSHQIPAKKLSGEEASGLPKDCWELDPASLTPSSFLAYD